MRTLYFLLFILIFIIALLFSLLNLDPVRVYFYKGFFLEAPLAVVLTLEFLAGIAVGLAVGFSRYIKLKTQANVLQKKLTLAESKLESMTVSVQHND